MVDGEGLAAAIMMGASGVWMGTRFLLAEEATVARAFQEAVQSAGYDDTIRTIIYSVSLLFFGRSGTRGYSNWST
jgi:NAD(P)H-dependent flavin oxidoreductase YrpB (nitropropane dioxygenase family)